MIQSFPKMLQKSFRKMFQHTCATQWITGDGWYNWVYRYTAHLWERDAGTSWIQIVMSVMTRSCAVISLWRKDTINLINNVFNYSRLRLSAHALNRRVTILVPRGHNPFSQHQESGPLAGSNTGSPRISDFQSNLTNLIGWEYRTNTLRMFNKLVPARGPDSWCWPKGSWPLGTRMEGNEFLQNSRKSQIAISMALAEFITFTYAEIAFRKTNLSGWRNWCVHDYCISHFENL